jgi:type IV pilus assembly protein PilE
MDPLIQLGRPIVVKSRTGGFTLMELMIVVAIIAIVAAVALPSYFGSVRKSHRSEAFAAISQIQQAQERFRAENSTYANRFVLSGTTLTRVSTVAGDQTQWDLDGGRYRLTFTGTPDQFGYVVQAIARGGQTSDTSCATMTVTVANGGNASYSPAECYSR